MYQQSPIPYRRSTAVEHPGCQGPTNPYGISIACPRPSRPVNLAALKFYNRPPATPVERWIKSYTGRPAVPSTAPANAAAATHFYGETVLVCHFNKNMHTGYLFGPLVGPLDVTNRYGFDERHFRVNLERWGIKGLSNDLFSPERGEIMRIPAPPLLQSLRAEVDALTGGAIQEPGIGSLVLVGVWMPGSTGPDLISVWVASEVVGFDQGCWYVIEVLRGVYAGLQFRVKDGQLLDLNQRVIDVLGKAGKFVEG